MHRKFAAGVFSALILLAVSPAAAAVRYVFTAQSSYDGLIGSLSYTTDNFLTESRYVPAANLDRCNVDDATGRACSSATFYVVASTNPNLNDDSDLIEFVDSTAYHDYYFTNGAFAASGTYQSILFGAEQAGTLVVSEVGGVPEPTTWALMIGGFGMIGGAMRRRAMQGIAASA